MLNFIKSFLKWISPIEIISAPYPVEEIATIDKKFRTKQNLLLNKEAQAILYASLLSQIVALTHQTVINAYTAELSYRRPSFARMMLTDPNNPAYKKEINNWVKKWSFIKPEEADKLGAEILELIFKRFHNIAVLNEMNNNRLFVNQKLGDK